jgi:hypothetical protein
MGCGLEIQRFTRADPMSFQEMPMPVLIAAKVF